MDASTIVIPFSLVGAGPGSWLQQIAELYRQAVQGDVEAVKTLRTVAGQSDDQWVASHPDALTLHNDPHAYDYARNAYKAAWAALQGQGSLQPGGAAATPMATATRKFLYLLVAAVAVYFLVRWLR